MKRLPPQPTNTALARLVRRIFDAMPWVMARNLREARADLARVRGLNAHLREENYDLRMDFEELMHDASLLPDPEWVGTRIDDYGHEPVLIISVEYPRLKAAVGMRREHLQISAAAAEALKCAAERVAYGVVKPHRDALIQRALGGKSIDEVVKARVR